MEYADLAIETLCPACGEPVYLDESHVFGLDDTCFHRDCYWSTEGWVFHPRPCRIRVFFRDKNGNRVTRSVMVPDKSLPEWRLQCVKEKIGHTNYEYFTFPDRIMYGMNFMKVKDLPDGDTLINGESTREAAAQP